MDKPKIWVIAPEGYDELVTEFVKWVNDLPHVCAESMTVQQYAANVIEPSDENRLLFIGDADENPFTTYVYPKIAFKLAKECGAYYGGDSKRMLIFGDGDMSHRKQLKILFDKQKKGDVDTSTPDAKTGPSFMAFALVTYMATFSLILPILTMGGMFLFGKAYKKKLRFLQVTLGMERLLEALVNYK